MRTTYYTGREAQVSFTADVGSKVVWIDVSGRRVPLGVESAERAAVKLADAARRAKRPNS